MCRVQMTTAASILMQCMLLGDAEERMEVLFPRVSATNQHVNDHWEKRRVLRKQLTGELHCALISHNTMRELQCEEGDWVVVEGVPQERIHLRAITIDSSLKELLAPEERTVPSHADNKFSSPKFICACSSIKLYPGLLHHVSRAPFVPSSLLKSVTFSRLLGHTYFTDENKESEVLRQWFSHQKQVVRPGDILPVPAFSGLAESCFALHCDEHPIVFWYFVHAVDPQNESSKNNDKTSGTFFSVPESTSIYLSENIKATNLPLSFFQVSRDIFVFSQNCRLQTASMIAALSREVYVDSDTQNALRPTIQLRSNVLEHYLEWTKHLFFEYSHENVCSFPINSAPAHIQAHSACVVQTKSHLGDLHLTLLEGILPFSTDVLADLMHFSLKNNVVVYELNYRHFLYAAIDSMTRKKEVPSVFAKVPLKPQYYFNYMIPPSHSQENVYIDIEEIYASKRPCIVCISNIDDVINVEIHTADQIKRSADELLCKYVFGVFSHLRAKGNDGKTVVAAVSMVATTAHLDQLSPDVLNHFPRHLIDSTVMESEDSCPEVVKSACTHMSETLGRVHLAQYVDELQLLSLQNSWVSQRVSCSSHIHDSCSDGSDIALIAANSEDIKDLNVYAKRGIWGALQSQAGENRNEPSRGVENIHWDDVGGIESIRKELIDTLALVGRGGPVDAPAIPCRTGVLLHGPPGTGKTLIAKALASECGMSFLSVKGPELLDMYIGESERQVRSLFEKAKQMQPCIIFFDELDSLAPARGKGSGGASGVLDRVVSQLLIELDNLNNNSSSNSDLKHAENAGMFVIGATNRPDLLDAALLRPGRFDKKIYLGPCQTRESKTKILKAQTRNYVLADDVSIENIVSLLDYPITGAELSAIVSIAYENALEKKMFDLKVLSRATDVETKVGGYDKELRLLSSYLDDLDEDEDILNIKITYQDFRHAILRSDSYS